MAKRNPTSISKTAIDSQHAKLSAIDAGWLHSDANDPTSHPLHVYTNLLQQLHHGPKRRQSPLVNAGYAARMAVMTYTLERWVDHVASAFVTDQRGDIQRINVVMVGCGMDALGIWSKHLLYHSLSKRINDSGDRSDCLSLRLYEVDCFENCVLKKESLLRSGLLTADSTENVTDDERDASESQEQHYYLHVKGHIGGNDYTLVSLDLRVVQGERSILSQGMSCVGLDASQPTIVLSELVLAYLGQKGANATMSSISDIIHENKLSMFACLEPMFPTDDTPLIDRVISLQEAYARDYSQQFLGKLHNGNSDQYPQSLWLHPLCSNLQTLQQRLDSCGLMEWKCTTLRECTADIARILRGKVTDLSSSSADIIGPKFLCAKEPFDEHAALTLNLGCYCVVCSFHPSLSQVDSCGMIESICPWYKQSTNERERVMIKLLTTATEDTQVNDLYGKLYMHLYNEYPAIRKIVKSALKSDLLVSNDSLESSIRDRFINDGGDFWVALASVRSQMTAEQTDPAVVGSIGIKRRSRKGMATNDAMNNSQSNEYEICRFAVNESYRGCGVGSQLLRAAEGFVASSAFNGSSELYAVTPSCLLAANSLYESFGYSLDSSACFMAGLLRMNVYHKTVSA
ncbi:hypothetical protein ACHAWO_003036 [Cyclotella atomus]|uniref:[phosphatase 2A protein]-leucine-carboxy methyltransferase n=1 Tax=Cyclotella atomus TaxID=382360 RepID=A0ABD3NHZ3_9STRA